MKKYILIAALSVITSALMAADAKEEVVGAAKKLAEKGNYSWKSTSENPGSQFRTGPTEGKTEKDGYTVVVSTRNENTTEMVLKGDKGAIKTQDGWKTVAELADAQGGGGGQGNPGRFMARTAQNFKAPAAEAQDLAGKAKELKKTDDTYASDLTEDGAKELLSWGRRAGGGEGPSVSNAKGSVKFWIKDGVLSKYETKVKGTVSFNGNDRDVDRTTTVEIKDVGITKVEVSDEAKKKAS